MIVNILASSPAKPTAPCLDLTKLIVLLRTTSCPDTPLADVAVIITEPLSCVSPEIVTLLLDPGDIADVTPVPSTLDIVYSEFLFVVPSNTSISVNAPLNDTIVPSLADANV